MNADDTVLQYVDTLRIRGSSRSCYVSVLKHFQATVVDCTSMPNPFSTTALREWLLIEVNRLSLGSVLFQVGIIKRYLDWLALRGAAPNPIAALCDQHGGRLTPIVRALVGNDHERALERLRPPPPYGSTLGPVIREHVVRMQSLGLRYETKERDLRAFDRFLQRRPDLDGAALPALVDAWRKSLSGARQQLRAQQCGRALSQALHRRDLTTPILSIDIGLQRRVLNEERKPYIFSDAEVHRLFDAARTFPTRNAPLRPIALFTMLTLAYCVGLRVGEIASLKLNDLDLDDGLLEIRDTKFFKSRRLPLPTSVIEVLSRYLIARASAGAPTASDAPLWWSALRRRAYSYSQVNGLLRRVIRRAGLKSARGRIGPRVHDLRHTFVAHRMARWYRDGVDVQNRLPYLATYLGHKDIQSTLVYLNTTPDVLQQASERYRRHGIRAMCALGGEA